MTLPRHALLLHITPTGTKDILMREFDKWEQKQDVREKPTVGNALVPYQ